MCVIGLINGAQNVITSFTAKRNGFVGLAITVNIVLIGLKKI
jgi:hypothetical protein